MPCRDRDCGGCRASIACFERPRRSLLPRWSRVVLPAVLLLINSGCSIHGSSGGGRGWVLGLGAASRKVGKHGVVVSRHAPGVDLGFGGFDSGVAVGWELGVTAMPRDGEAWNDGSFRPRWRFRFPLSWERQRFRGTTGEVGGVEEVTCRYGWYAMGYRVPQVPCYLARQQVGFAAKGWATGLSLRAGHDLSTALLVPPDSDLLVRVHHRSWGPQDTEVLFQRMDSTFKEE